ncbi:MAG: ATP-binding protein [Kofleriaceae bacterium]
MESIDRLVEQLSDSVVCCDRGGTIVSVNAVASRTFCRSSVDVVGAPVTALFGCASQMASVVRRVGRTGSAEQLEYFDPEHQRWYNQRLYLVDERVYIMARDITEERAAVARLEILATTSRLFSGADEDVRVLFDKIARHIADALHDLCSIRLLSPDGQRFEPPVGLWDSSPEIRELLEGTPASDTNDAIGPEVLRTGQPVVMWSISPSDMAARIAPSDRQSLVEQLGLHSVMVVPLRARGSIVGIVSVARRLSGTRAPYVNADLKLLEELADRAALVVHQWQTFRMVETAKQRLTVIGDSLPVLISLVDRDERYVFVNATYTKWFGVEPSELVGKSLIDVVGPDAYDVMEPHVRAVLAGHPTTYQTRVPYATGARDVRAVYTPYVVAGKVEGFVALIADITDTAQMEDDLKSAIVARDEFVSIASHELRTPLTALELQLDGLQRMLDRNDVAEQPQIRRKVRVAARQADRLAALVDSLLSVNRLGVGSLRLELQQFMVSSLVDEVVDRFAEDSARAGCAVSVVCPDTLDVRWDRARIDQVLTSLIANALKYAPGKPVDLKLALRGNDVHLTMRDRGIGISHEDVTRIFGKYERAVPVQHYGGLGLGLYITRQIIDAHGGDIDVASCPGEGTVFTVRLPRYAAHPGPSLGSMS